MDLTTAQKEAIAARGNVLLVAGAGTGKTHTLVERVQSLLEGPSPASLDEMLMVTFTDAAAAQMRERLGARFKRDLDQELERINHALEKAGNGTERSRLERARSAALGRWEERTALLEISHIGTLHSFCLRLVQQHFYELELDPQLSVLAEEESVLLASETLDRVLEDHYAGRSNQSEAVQQLIQSQGGGSDQLVRALVLRLHHYTQTRPDPEGWFNEQSARFGAVEPSHWLNWLEKAVPEWRNRWLPFLEGLPAENEPAGKCAELLTGLRGQPGRAQAAAVLEAVVASCQDCPRGRRGLWLKPLESMLAEAAFLASLAGVDGKTDPVVEDWSWVRTQMAALLKLAQEFHRAFSDAKHEMGVLDFHDLEQYALRLLWDSRRQRPTPIAELWREKLRFVFVDEYQDINAAQDKIIEAVSREGKQANRFLVGDVKQSIYRFRLADPHIFQNYAATWQGDQGRTIQLTDNFRSREPILKFINSVFAVLMRPEVGGVLYDEEAQLRFGATSEHPGLRSAANPAPCVELHLRVKGAPREEGDGEAVAPAAELLDLEEADKEARLVALRLRELKEQQLPIWDDQEGRFRPVEWRDMAILLRSPANKSESYAKEFSRVNVPLTVERGGFYESLEITDLLSLLQVLDNPLQDLPVLAVLRSPLVGLTLDELATIRLTARRVRFWTALVRWEERAKSEILPRVRDEIRNPTLADAACKVGVFLERFGRWRRLARQGSLSRCLESVLAETHYADWLLTQSRAGQRRANVQRLLSLAQRFDRFQRQGLFRFLNFVEAQREAEAEPEVTAVSAENCVRLMSIHQSKGLEFPVVAVADLGKPFNLSDLRSEVILDEEYGLCPQIKPPHTGKRYPSLPYWLAGRRQKRELLGEELRLLYVAMTRARDRLILSGSISKSNRERLWSGPAEVNETALLSARSFADWLGLWFSRDPARCGVDALAGQDSLLRWAIHDDAELIGAGSEPSAEASTGAMAADPAVWDGLRQRLSWQYAFGAATREAAKTSVSALRRRAAEVAEGEANMLFVGPEDQFEKSPIQRVRDEEPRRRQTGAAVGSAHHRFLQMVSLERVGSEPELRQEAERLQRAGVLNAEEVARLDLEGLAAFWDSDFGRKVRAQGQFVQRELAFTVRFSPAELAAITGEGERPGLEDEFVVVQGVADLAVVRPEAIWLADFKTDRLEPDDLPEKVRAYQPQLRLYAQALERIYQRPVAECWLYFLTVRQAVLLDPLRGQATK